MSRAVRRFGLNAVLVLLALSLSLAACAPAATPTPVVVEKVVTATPPPPKQMPTLHVVFWPGPESDAFQKVVDFFNANRAQEAGFQVTLELFGRDQFMTKQEAAMAAKSTDVDTWFISSRWLGKYYTFCDPLDGYYADPTINIYGAEPTLFMQTTLDGMTWLDGKLYGVLTDLGVHFTYYRKDYIDQLMTDPSWQATYRAISKAQMGKEMEPKRPEDWTWDDFLAASYFFTQKYNPDSPTVYGNFTHGKVMGPTAFLWTNALWAYGGDWFTADGTPNFDTPATHTAVELYRTFWEKGLTPPSSAVGEYPEQNEAFMSGQVCFGLQWSAAFHQLDDPTSPVTGKFAIAVPPGGPAGRFSYQHTLAMALNKYSAHKNEAARFLMWCSTEEAMTMYAAAGGLPPVESILSVATATHPEFPMIASTTAKYGRALSPVTGVYEDIVAENLSNAWSGQVPVDTAIKQMQADCLAEKQKRGL
jgi:multiple sugar transport system substrate-binding protein